jgi:hypothetical protein
LPSDQKTTVAADLTVGAITRRRTTMSEVRSAPLKELRQALCLECGAVRHAKVTYIGRGSRKLRCDGCQRTTVHAAVNWEGVDDREEANRKQAQGNAETVRELAALVSMFRSVNIEVLIAAADATSTEMDPMGGLVDVVRWLEPEAYQVRLARLLSPADQVYCLDWAWKSMRPAVARWHRCPVESDEDGELFQRIYNSGLELGIFVLS